jgi:hypothetical protein
MSTQSETSGPVSQPTSSVIGEQASRSGIVTRIGKGLRKWDAKSIDLGIGALLCILAALTWLPRATGPIDLRWDGGAYYLLGASITQGQGYRLLNEPGSPNTTLHPPLLPMFVAVHQLLLGTTDSLAVGRALRASACLLFALQALAMYVLLRRHIALSAAFLATLFWIFHPANTYFSDALYAEPLFGLTIMLFFILHNRTGGRKHFLLAAACAVIAFLARTTGILLFAAWAGESLLKRNFRQAAAIAVIALAAAGLWMGYIHHVESSPQYARPAYAYQHADYLYFNISYAKQILRLVNPFEPELGYLTPYKFAKRLYSNTKNIPAVVGQAVFSWQGGQGISLLVALLVFSGLLLQVARKRYIISFFFVLNLAAMCMTPFPKQFVRYLLPLSSLVFLLFFEALAWLNAQSRAHRSGFVRGAAPVLTIVLLAVMGGEELRDELDLYCFHHNRIDYLHDRQRVSYCLFYYSPGDREIDQGLDWLRVQARQGDIVAASDPQWAYLRAGLKSVLPPLESDGRKAERLIDSVPVRYLFVDENVYRRYTFNLVKSNPEYWKCVWRDAEDRVRIYERLAYKPLTPAI